MCGGHADGQFVPMHCVEQPQNQPEKAGLLREANRSIRPSPIWIGWGRRLPLSRWVGKASSRHVR